MSTFDSDRPRPRPSAGPLPGDPAADPIAPGDPASNEPAAGLASEPTQPAAAFVDPEPAPDTATRLLPRQPVADSAVIKAIVLSAVALAAALIVGWLGIRRLVSRSRRDHTSD